MQTDSELVRDVRDDSDVQRDVLDELAWEPSVNSAHIGVSVKDGVVTLSGHVDSYAEKYAAEDAAKRVDGVRAVANELDVKLPSRSKRTDEDLAQAAVDALKWNILVPSRKIKVTVSQGWVTLEGEVNWQFQRNATERAVRNLPGVRGVSNYITIKPDVSAKDIQSQIEEAFKRSAEVDADRIAIELDGDKVILRGTVKTWAEREEAERVAWSVPGISGVENLITVSSS
jgi:osmotically-inducible protein OsmY